jgi:hypothetical protein
VGPTWQRRRGKPGYRFGKRVDGPRAGFCSGPIRFPLAFFYFFVLFFFFFCFLISFVTFANMLQINSNHFHKFCKIHNKVLNQ